MPKRPKLSIGMACYDDFDGVWFSVKSLLLYHSEVMRDAEVVVVDNHPRGKHGEETKKFVDAIDNGKYVEFDDHVGTAQPRNKVFEVAQGEIVVCIDPHVLIEAGALRKLLDYFERQPDCRDLLQGPIIGDRGNILGTHQRLEWKRQALGRWTVDERGTDPDAEPFEIPQQGMGCFACRKEAWLGFHPLFRGFGGCESYVAEKYRREGHKVLCLPFLRWHHRFPRPNGVPYALDAKDQLQNYLITAEEMKWDADEMFAGYFHDLDPQAARELADRVKEEHEGVAQPRRCRHVNLNSRMEFRRIEIDGALRQLAGSFQFKCDKCGLPFHIVDHPAGAFVLEPKES